MSPAVDIDLDEGMDKVRAILTKYPIKTRLNLRGTLIVARDIAHARIKQMLDEGQAHARILQEASGVLRRSGQDAAGHGFGFVRPDDGRTYGPLTWTCSRSTAVRW